MENKKRKSKAIIISLIALIVLGVSLFLIYKNRDSFGVKTSATIAKIFNPLETSENRKKEIVQAGEDISKGDGVFDTGQADSSKGGTRIVKKAAFGDKDGSNAGDKNGGTYGNILGYANSDILMGETGEITLVDSKINSFWSSFSDFLGKTFDFNFKFKAVCEDNKDNDEDGKTDADDPNCHRGGDLNKDYVPNHYSESENPVEFSFVCSDTKDNDEDGKTDADDPNCHRGGDLNKEYVPNHYSESENPPDFDNDIQGIDLTPSRVRPLSSPINTEVDLTSTISNLGNESASQNFTVLFTISNNREGVSDNNSYLTSTIQSVESKSSEEAVVKYIFPTVGNYYIRVCADKKDVVDEGIVGEANENNNCSDWITFTVTNTLPDSGKRPECSDEKDNDGDGLIDTQDPTCHKGGDLNQEYLPEYNSESIASTECSDTLDNDGDGLIDKNDPVCHYLGDINEIYLPKYNSESQSSFQCNDTLDNDKDGKTDYDDPNCHVDGDLNNEYKPTHNSESESPAGPNVCLQLIPIRFTDEEQSKLDELLRKFYLIAPNLKSETDIALLYDEINNQQNFIAQVDALTSQCYARLEDPSYAGPKTQYGNPWYQYNNRGSYVAEYTTTTTSYCKNDPAKPKPRFFDSRLCSTFKTRNECEGLTRSPNFLLGFSAYYEKTSCSWVDTIDLKEYETLLNVW